MANKYTQEVHGSCIEGIRVKISERYKPPPKINLLMSSSQRPISEQIRAASSYEFILEDSAIKRINEWKTARSTIVEQRKDRVKKAREERSSKNDKKMVHTEMCPEGKEVEIDSMNKNTVACPNYNGQPQNCEYYVLMNHSNSFNTSLLNVAYEAPTYSSSSNMLIPTRASMPYNENMSTPSTTTNPENKTFDHTAFNISDFEADTSSPFDNMELKSINDMEELARVLKTTDASTVVTTTPFYTAYPMQVVPHNPTNFPSYQVTGGNRIYNISTDMIYSQAQTCIPSVGNTNESYCKTNQPLSSYLLSSDKGLENVPLNANTLIANESYGTVPDIMDSLETRIAETRLKNSAYNQSRTIHTSDIGKSDVTGSAITNKISRHTLELDDQFHPLPKNVQDLSKSISSMGFPLPMVARTCKYIGNDSKKIGTVQRSTSSSMSLTRSQSGSSNSITRLPSSSTSQRGNGGTVTECKRSSQRRNQPCEKPASVKGTRARN